MIATLVKSDIEFPEQAYKFIAFYLMFAIGLNGGVELAGTGFQTFVWPALATIFLAILLPTACYCILRTVFRFDIANAAGVAALYGSVSSVTFVAGIWCRRNGQHRLRGLYPHSEHYFTDYSVTAFVHDVRVVRAERYV